MNEAQISVALHQHYATATSLSGTLPFVIGEEILSRASTLEQALDILWDAKVTTAWAFVVTDGKTRDGFIFESHARASAVRWLKSEGILAHSNYFQTTPCQKGEYATSARMNWDNLWRKRRLETLVRASGDSLRPQTATQFLSDHVDGYWEEEKVVNRIVSQVYNIQSYVLDPCEMKVWIAVGNPPVQIRKYVEYDLGSLFSGKSPPSSGTELPAYRFHDEKIKLAKEKYIVSFVEAFEGNFDKALRLVKESLNENFSAEVALVGGVISLKKKEYANAIDLFQRGLDLIERKRKERDKLKFPPEYFELTLYLARAHDLLNRRAQAEAIYAKLSSHAELEDENLRAIARSGEPYTEKNLSRIVMPYSTYIPFL